MTNPATPVTRYPLTAFPEPIMDVRELLRETLLNKAVLTSLDDILRTSIIAMTRVLEVTGQPVGARKRLAETINERTRLLFVRLDELAARLCTLGDAQLEQGHTLTSAETELLVSANGELDCLGKEIDVLLDEHTALWRVPQLRGKSGT